MRPLDSILDLLDVLRRYVWDAVFALILLTCLATLALIACLAVGLGLDMPGLVPLWEVTGGE